MRKIALGAALLSCMGCIEVKTPSPRVVQGYRIQSPYGTWHSSEMPYRHLGGNIAFQSLETHSTVIVSPPFVVEHISWTAK